MYYERITFLTKTMGISSLMVLMCACKPASQGFDSAAYQRSLAANGSSDASSKTAANTPLENKSQDAGRASGSSDSPPPLTADTSEGVHVPTSITGTLLYCFKEKVEGETAILLCGLQDEKSGNTVPIASQYQSHSFALQATPGLAVSKRDLPGLANWQTEFTIKAKNPSQLLEELKKISVEFAGVDAAGTKRSLKSSVIRDSRPTTSKPSREPTMRDMPLSEP